MSLGEIKNKLEQKRGAKEIERPNKMIKIELHFWTNNISSEEGKAVPKVCWDSGTIHLLENEGHGIERSDLHFHHLSELVDKIEEAVRTQGIKVLKSRQRWDIYYP
ncbi:MAG: hypothetical protein GWO20_00570 [Candidatus Korarchaeota archaeon]|nr:hypothetical protein [Candidatus Korarchaeota archaeon]NIU82074.1 hypothetical protein [Candidatus Thorarchaeota archaeon]NIW12494.1 hypothetical protein [Candidatus Thorarchaeota archaeon]NIW50708.1 hypothetical protein [Candidatus Korarchaeota archaeon]